jgi:tetratricopeptide (TPR) repeat protein
MNKYIKLLIAVLLVGAGIYFMFWGRQIALGILLVILAIVPILLFFRNEYILMALFKLRKQDLTGARVWLDKITNIKIQLIRKQHGYYNYLMGITESQGNYAKAETYMKTALEYGLSFKQDRALATLNLAAAALMRGHKTDAERLMGEAKKLDTSNMLGDQIKMLKEQMKRVNVSRSNMINPNMRNRSKFMR